MCISWTIRGLSILVSSVLPFFDTVHVYTSEAFKANLCMVLLWVELGQPALRDCGDDDDDDDDDDPTAY